MAEDTTHEEEYVDEEIINANDEGAEGAGAEENSSGNTGESETPGEGDGEASGGGEETPPTFQVKVDGEMVDVSQEELLRGYSHGAAATQKFQEADRLNKQATGFIKELKNNPLSILMDKRLGLDFDKIIEQYTTQKAEYDGMSEEQRELITARQKIAKYESDNQQATKTREEQAMAQHAEQIVDDIHVAIDAGSLPNNDFVVGRYINYLTIADQKGIEVTPAALTELVAEDYREAITEMMGKASSEDLISMIGKDAMKGIRKHEVDVLKAGDGETTRKGEVIKPAGGGKKKGEKVDLESWKEEMGIF